MRQVIRAAGEILLTAGVIGLLFIGYLVWGTGLRAASAQRALTSELNQQWRTGMLTLILLAAAAALWFYVFPWASIHLPIDTSGFGG